MNITRNINICVFCGSMHGNSGYYSKQAFKLGYNISENKWNLIYGGGNLGLMGSLAKGYNTLQSHIISVVPRELNYSNILYSKASKKILVDNLFLRKKKMLELSDFIIVLPGGIGTLDELLDIMANNQLSKKNIKIIILNLKKYWDPLKELLYHMNKSNFINDIEKCNIHFLSTVEKTIKFIKNNL